MEIIKKNEMNPSIFFTGEMIISNEAYRLLGYLQEREIKEFSENDYEALSEKFFRENFKDKPIDYLVKKLEGALKELNNLNIITVDDVEGTLTINHFSHWSKKTNEIQPININI